MAHPNCAGAMVVKNTRDSQGQENIDGLHDDFNVIK